MKLFNRNKTNLLIRGYKKKGLTTLFTYLFYMDAETDIDRDRLYGELHISYNPMKDVTTNLIENKFAQIRGSFKELSKETVEDIKRRFKIRRQMFFFTEIVMTIYWALFFFDNPILDTLTYIASVILLHMSMNPFFNFTFVEDIYD